MVLDLVAEVRRLTTRVAAEVKSAKLTAAWGSISGTPATFPPSAHTHSQYPSATGATSGKIPQTVGDGTWALIDTPSGGGGGGGGAYRGAWRSDVAYTAGQTVSAAGAYWIATSDNTNSAPTAAFTYTQAGANATSAGIYNENGHYLAFPFQLTTQSLVAGFDTGWLNQYLSGDVKVGIATAAPVQGGTAIPPMLVALTTVSPISAYVQNNMYMSRLLLGDPMLLEAHTSYWLYIERVAAGNWSDDSPAQYPAATGANDVYSGIREKPTGPGAYEVGNTLPYGYVRTATGSWGGAAGFRMFISTTLTVPVLTWERLARENVLLTDIGGLSEYLAGALPTAWTAYTPSVGGSGGNPSLGGGGSIAGRYRQWSQRRILEGETVITFGSAPAVGGGYYYIQLPTGFSSAAGLQASRVIGYGQWYDPGTSKWYPLIAQRDSGNGLYFRIVAHNGGYGGAAAPFVPVQGTVIHVRWEYDY